MIYADNAATTKLDIDAFQAMKPFLLDSFGNASQPYFFSKKAKRAIKEARTKIANCIGALPEEIYFTSGGTESDNWAIKNFGNDSDVKHIVTSKIEHHAILNSCEHVQNYGTEVTYVSVNQYGEVNIEEIEDYFQKKQEYITSCDMTLVSIMFANNEIGTIQPIKKIAEIAHRNGALVHTDAVQALGHININVDEMGIDMLSASAHKFNGPKGIGFLYIRNGIVISSHNDGGAQENYKRAGTENVPAIVAMSVALEKNCINIKKNAEKLKKFEEILLVELKSNNIDFIRNGSDIKIPGNISLSFKDFDGEMILHRLDLKGICVSTGSACDSKETQISHVLKAIRLPEDYAKGTIRISLGKDNTEEDVLFIAQSLIQIIKEKKIL